MSRRFHKKSKAGCDVCKRRHIKCDEHRPTCVNCQTSSFPCTYAQSPLADTPTEASRENSPGVSTLPASHGTKEEDQQHVINLDHVELFCHFCSEIWKDLSSTAENDQDMIQESFRQIQQTIHSSPFLIHQALAIAALHLSIIRPDRVQYYRNYASGLQARAVSLFNDLVSSVDASNCVPAFLFSSLLGIHSLCETLRYHGDDFENFLERFGHYLHLHRGVRAITSQSWHIINRTKLLSHTKGFDVGQEEAGTKGTECDTLASIIQHATLDSASREAYNNAAMHLQETFDMHRNLATKSASVHAVFAWPVVISTDYTNLLLQEKTEALIILAHYAIILHWHRELWIFGDGGRFLIESISRKLGLDGETLLRWPLAEIGGLPQT